MVAMLRIAVALLLVALSSRAQQLELRFLPRRIELDEELVRELSAGAALAQLGAGGLRKELDRFFRIGELALRLGERLCFQPSTPRR